MAIVLRITSADGKNTIMKTLPGLPAHIKVPAGARVEVMDPDSKRVETLALYVNRHAQDKDKDGEHHAAQVSVETAANWAETEAWLNSMGDMAQSDPKGSNWFYSGDEDSEGSVLGFDQNTLFIGGLVGVGVAGAGYALSGGKSGPKDDIAPAAPRSLDLATADDNGTSTTDNITTLTSGLTIAGLAEIGASVELFNGTTSLGKATADASGVFTIDVSLAEGEHSITAKATDKAGNVSTESAVLKIVVDKTAPAAPTAIDLAAADDTGLSNTDNITKQTSALTITGTAEAGSTVELFDGTTSLGTAVTNTTGTFTKDISLAAGSHSITVKATDVVGQTGAASEALTIVVDDSVPAVPTGLDLAAEDDTGSSNTDNITSKSSGLTISGLGEAGATVELFDGTTSLGTATVDAAGAFTKDVSLAAGAHSITAKTTDTAGNTSASSSPLVILVDTTVAAAGVLDLATADDTGISSTDNITNKTTGLTISGTGEAGGTVELFDGTTSLGTATVATGGTYSRDISLSAGTHSITAKVTDTSGNVGAASEALTIVVDTTAPVAPTSLDLAAEDDLGVANGDNITSRTSGLTITGVAEAGSTVELFDGTTSLGTATAGSNGIFSRDIALIEGNHAITAKATDTAGNVSTASTALNLIVDTTAPPPPSALDLAADDDDGSSNSDNITSKTSGLTVTGSAEAGSTVELFDGSTSLGTVIAGSGGTFSHDISLGVGNHSITAKASDAAGNFGSASSVLNINVVATPASEALTVESLNAASDVNHLSLFDSTSSFG